MSVKIYLSKESKVQNNATLFKMVSTQTLAEASLVSRKTPKTL